MKNGLYGALLLLLTGCITGNFQTNIDYESLHQFKRILVVSKLTGVSPSYLNSWLTAFPEAYEVCVLDASKLAFGDPDSLASQKARACSSDVVLTLDLNRSYTASSGKYTSAYNEIFMQMAFLPTNKPFWKAITLDTQPNHVVRQLVADAIIEGKVPPPFL